MRGLFEMVLVLGLMGMLVVALPWRAERRDLHAALVQSGLNLEQLQGQVRVQETARQALQAERDQLQQQVAHQEEIIAGLQAAQEQRAQQASPEACPPPPPHRMGRRR